MIFLKKMFDKDKTFLASLSQKSPRARNMSKIWRVVLAVTKPLGGRKPTGFPSLEVDVLEPTFRVSTIAGLKLNSKAICRLHIPIVLHRGQLDQAIYVGL